MAGFERSAADASAERDLVEPGVRGAGQGGEGEGAGAAGLVAQAAAVGSAAAADPSSGGLGLDRDLDGGGLVEAEGQRGFAVMPASLADLIDITETRRLLECHAARLSVERADLEWESRLVASYHKLSKAEELVVQDADQHADLLETYNREFHGALISGCNSRWLLHFHGLMYDQSLRYRMLAFRVKDFPRDQSRREHKQILDAALTREVDALVTVLGTHITKGAEMYAEHEAAAQGRGKTRRKVKR